MANLPEISQFDDGIRQIETTDPVLGGPDGIANSQGKALANRTRFLKDRQDKLLSGETVPPGFATQDYVQRQMNMLDAKQSVRAATTASISLTGAQSIDGVSVVAGDRVLVKNQADAKTNGIYVVSGSTWSRAGDADEQVEVTPGLVVYVEEGAIQGRSRWQLISNAPVILGTSALSFGDITSGMAPLKSPAFTETPTAPKAPQFATGGQIITADALKSAGMQFSGMRFIDLSVASASVGLSDVGGIVVITGSGGGTINLPKASNVPAGATISVLAANTSVSTNTLKAASGDTIYGALQSVSPAGVLRSGDSATLVSDGSSSWYLISDGNYNFVAQAVSRIMANNQSLGVTGYKVDPGGLINQWGTVTLGAVGAFNSQSIGGVTWYSHFYTVSLPISYGNSHLSVVASMAGRPASSQASEILAIVKTNKTISGNAESLSSFTLSITTPQTGWTPTINFESKGT